MGLGSRDNNLLPNEENFGIRSDKFEDEIDEPEPLKDVTYREGLNYRSEPRARTHLAE